MPKLVGFWIQEPKPRFLKKFAIWYQIAKYDFRYKNSSHSVYVTFELNQKNRHVTKIKLIKKEGGKTNISFTCRTPQIQKF